jgi:hypothetical protein
MRSSLTNSALLCYCHESIILALSCCDDTKKAVNTEELPVQRNFCVQAVGSMLSNLKNMASDMGQEIEKQNSQLDKIGAKVSST